MRCAATTGRRENSMNVINVLTFPLEGRNRQSSLLNEIKQVDVDLK
jgi:hypothetical protein